MQKRKLQNYGVVHQTNPLTPIGIKFRIMKETDGLQIGNFVYYKNTEDIATVHLIHGKKHFDCNDEYGFTPNGNYEAIKLDQDWLIKLGYSVQPWGWVKENMPLIAFSKDKYWVNFGNGFRIDLPYVHTLQNLEQLTIKK